MTKKQLQTLKLFAMNYSLDKIAQKLRVSKSTIRSRLRVLNLRPEFDNAYSIRSAYKCAKWNIEHPISLEECRGIL